MCKEEQKRVYFQIGSGRLLDIVVILDDKLVFEGMIEDVPDDIKKLKYSKAR